MAAASKAVQAWSWVSKVVVLSRPQRPQQHYASWLPANNPRFARAQMGLWLDKALPEATPGGDVDCVLAAQALPLKGFQVLVLDPRKGVGQHKEARSERTAAH